MKTIWRLFFASFFSYSCESSWASSQQVDLKKRDLQHLEHLKQELAKAESMPGGLEYARQIQRQIQTIEKGTTIYTPELSHGEGLSKQSRTVPEQPMLAPSYPKRSDKGVLSLTEGGGDLDLFHEKTITVAEDYGVSRETMEAHRENKKQENDDLYKPLEMPNDERLSEPEPIVSKGAMNAPLYGFPVQGSHSTTATPTSTIDSDYVRVDAAQFQQRQQPLYGNPHGAGMHPSNSVIPPSTPHVQQHVAWTGDKSEAGYLEEQLKTKLSQLAHARQQLALVGGQEANAWTFRIHGLEAEKRSLMRMMASLGITPNFTKVSLKEDSEFDTIQSQEHLLKRQLYKTEKEEKKLRRQMHGIKDAEILTAMGDRLANLEMDKKLLEASLRTFQENSKNVDRSAFVSRPSVYLPVQTDSEPQAEEHLYALGNSQEQRNRTSHPDYIERVPRQIKAREKPVNVESDKKSYTVSSHKTDSVLQPEEENEDDAVLHQERSGFWTAGLPEYSDNPRKTFVEKPQRVDREEAYTISSLWNAE